MIQGTNYIDVYGDEAASSVEVSTAVALEAVTETIMAKPTDSKRSRFEMVYHTI